LRTLAHLSDLHLGRDDETAASAAALVAALDAAGVDQVLVTGDVTDRGRIAELQTFRRIFAPLGSGRVVVVPGNHDRLGDDAAGWLMRTRVHAQVSPGLFTIRLDSTAPHNRSLLDGHGQLTPRDIEEVEVVLQAAPAGALVVLMLHHHLHALPEDGMWERLATWAGWPNAAELALGGALLERLAGRCDLVLHGHRHAHGELVLGEGSARPLRVLNAGSSTSLRRVRVLSHADGRVVAERWLDCRVPASRQGADRDRAPAAA
jgi:3',5'-cyclic AMP phosphodiesterase CpdA